MEMDVNLVKCLRSTVGMSDIDRCYNEFILNGINPSTPVVHHNQHLITPISGGISSSTNGGQSTSSSSIKKATGTTTVTQSKIKPFKNLLVSSTSSTSTSSTSHPLKISELEINNLNSNNNQFNYKSINNKSTQQYSTSSIQSSTSSLSTSSSLSSSSTSTSTSSSPSLNRTPPATISGMLVRNNEMVNKNILLADNTSTSIKNNNNNNNNNDDDDDDDDDNELNSSNNIIYDNRIDYQYYQHHNSYHQKSKAKKLKNLKKNKSKLSSTATATTTTTANTNTRITSGSSSILGAIQQTPSTPISKGCCIALSNRNKINKTPQEIYFESRGKSCKKLLKFNGYSNKILLYPEESWARSAASSYWTIKPSWWQPNRCKVTEITGSQRYSTKAKMLCIEKGSLLVMGSFKKKLGDSDFKLYLSSNITMEDYNMGYCLTGWVERRCSQTNTFQMTHFAVIKRQWPPSINSNTNANTNDSKSN